MRDAACPLSTKGGGDSGPYTDSLHAAKVPHARRTAAAQPRGTLVQLQTGQALELFGSRASRP